MIPSSKEKAHAEICPSKLKSNPSVDEVAIPCEECGEAVAFSDYSAHLDGHRSNIKLIEEEKVATSKIPCDICKLEIPFNQYEEHIKAHESPATVKPEDSKLPEDPSLVVNPLVSKRYPSLAPKNNPLPSQQALFPPEYKLPISNLV